MNKDKIDIIEILPSDVQKYIYLEYAKPDIILTELNNILNSKLSQNLNQKELYIFLKKSVLNDERIIKYLFENDEIFKSIYEEHMIKGIKRFKEFEDRIQSFALSWLMYLYH